MTRTEKSLTALFLEAAQPDEETGHSRLVPIDELVALDPRFKLGNGGSWCRSDTSALGKKYNVHRERRGGRIVGVQLVGYKVDAVTKDINPAIVEQLRKARCVVLAVANDIQVDHKNGRYNDKRMDDISKQKLTDFQSLSRAANTAKRGHCQNCKATGTRFDARALGYSVAQWVGPEKFFTCVGCFWYDPVEFNRRVSGGYSPPE